MAHWRLAAPGGFGRWRPAGPSVHPGGCFRGGIGRFAIATVVGCVGGPFAVAAVARPGRGAGAETLAEEHVALLNANLATKADIARIEALRQETKADAEAVKSELLKWMIGLLIAQGGLIVALVKLL